MNIHLCKCLALSFDDPVFEFLYLRIFYLYEYLCLIWDTLEVYPIRVQISTINDNNSFVSEAVTLDDDMKSNSKIMYCVR